MQSSSVQANFRVVLSEFIFTGLDSNTTEVNDKFSISSNEFGIQSLKFLQKNRFMTRSHSLAYYGVGIDVQGGVGGRWWWWWVCRTLLICLIING